MLLLADLEAAIEDLLGRPSQSPNRLNQLADLIKRFLELQGLPGAAGGSGGELTVPGLARSKDWDIAFEFAGKFRLLVSLKSMLKNIAGSVPNRLDDLQGEIANIQQLRPEIVIGYVILFDVAQDSRRTDGTMWSDYFEAAISRISIRRAPLWNQGLLEGSWFVRFDSRLAMGSRIVDAEKTIHTGEVFTRSLLWQLHEREPAVEFKKAIEPPPAVAI